MDRSSAAEQEFVESLGSFMEQSGLPRMVGRILARLLLASPPLQSADALADALHVSRGTISTMTRLLIEMGLVERLGVPGERRDYFRMKPGAWAHMLRRNLVQLSVLRQFAAHGLALMQDQPADARQSLEEMHSLYSFCEQHYPALIAQWEAEHTNER